MHIVLVGPGHPYRGGIAHLGEQLTDALKHRGHTVTAVTFSRQYPKLFYPGTSQTVPDDRAPRAPRWIDSLNPFTWISAAQKIAAREPDLVVFQHWMPFFAPAFGTMARLLRRRGIPSVTIVHNALPHERHPGDAWLNRYLFNASRSLITLSEAVTEDLRRLGISVPIETSSHPTYHRFGTAIPKSEARRQLQLALTDRVLLFFGFVRAYKGLMTLIEALPAVRHQLPNIKLVVAGEFYDSERPYRQRLRELGLDPVVRLDAQYVPDELVPYYFSAADLVVQPYTRATQSGVAHIAMHFQRPLVVTDVGALSEDMEQYGKGAVVPPNDRDALSSAIIQHLQLHPGGQASTPAAQADDQGDDQIARTIERILQNL